LPFIVALITTTGDDMVPAYYLMGDIRHRRAAIFFLRESVRRPLLSSMHSDLIVQGSSPYCPTGLWLLEAGDVQYLLLSIGVFRR
jgi:hypothetical protein